MVGAMLSLLACVNIHAALACQCKTCGWPSFVGSASAGSCSPAIKDRGTCSMYAGTWQPAGAAGVCNACVIPCDQEMKHCDTVVTCWNHKYGDPSKNTKQDCLNYGGTWCGSDAPVGAGATSVGVPIAPGGATSVADRMSPLGLSLLALACMVCSMLV
jgi:hypothetical protein